MKLHNVIKRIEKWKKLCESVDENTPFTLDDENPRCQAYTDGFSDGYENCEDEMNDPYLGLHSILSKDYKDGFISGQFTKKNEIGFENYLDNL